VVPISYRNDVEHFRNLRNFDVEQEQPLNLTVADALLATLATPPLFMPITILKDAVTFEYISADLTLSNPIQQIFADAHGTFGAQREVACIVSLGCGHPGVIAPPNNSDTTSWNQFVERLVTGSEETARNVESLLGHLGFYHRFSVTRGLEKTFSSTSLSHGDTISHTADYLADPSVSRKADMSVNSLKMMDGVAYLEDLSKLRTFSAFSMYSLAVRAPWRPPSSACVSPSSDKDVHNAEGAMEVHKESNAG
jgi:hypothetical protein